MDGLEWNVRVSAARNAAVVAKVAAVYESYWQSGDFRPYDADDFDRETERADDGPTVLLIPIELRPEPFQERLVEQIAVVRHQGRHRNLLVSATGTGKTVMAALDYVRLRAELPLRLQFAAPVSRSWRLRGRAARCAFGPRRPSPRSSFLGLRPGDPRAEPGHVPLRHARAGVR